MKKTYIVLAVAVVGLLTFAVLKSGSSKVLNVNEVGADPAAFSGKISITGVSVGVHPQQPTFFGMYDKKELQCNSPNCNKMIIPVRYTAGPMPARGDEVVLTGSFTNQGGGFFFSCDKMKVVKNHRIAG